MDYKLVEPMMITVFPEMNNGRYLRCKKCKEGNYQYDSSFFATVYPLKDGGVCPFDLADELTGLTLKCSKCNDIIGIKGVKLYLDSGEELEY